jgi:hypothetical protein
VAETFIVTSCFVLYCCFLWAHTTTILSALSFSSFSPFFPYDEKPRHAVRFLYVSPNSACLSVCLFLLYKFPCFWTSSSARCIQGDKLLVGANSNAIKKKKKKHAFMPRSCSEVGRVRRDVRSASCTRTQPLVLMAVQQKYEY